VEHRRADFEAETGRPSDPCALPGEDQVIGKEVDEPAQEAAERAVRDRPAVEGGAACGLDESDRVVHAWQSIHDRRQSEPYWF
jgi:hypothetical protein